MVRYRLHNQFLSQTTYTRPEEVVSSLGAVQAQDYTGAKWALGLRMQGATDAAIEQAFNEGKVLRTHMMRPTWHFVAPEDIRWLLALTSARVHTANGFMYRQLELDQSTRNRSYGILERALQGNRDLTRPELGEAFEKAGIPAAGQRLGYLVMSAELDGIICSGPRRGKQFTYALLEERVRRARAWERDEALAELTRRYFATRAPATLHDFTWWSGLTMADAKRGIEIVQPQFVSKVIEQKTYWFDPLLVPAQLSSPTAHLLPNYDEYFIGFKDRSAIGKLVSPLMPEENSVALNAHIILLNGQIVGGWKRTIKRVTVQIEWMLIATLSKAEKRALTRAAEQYGEFLQVPVELVTI